MVRGPGVTTGRSGVLGKVFYVSEDFWPLNTSLWVKEFRHSKPAYAFHLLQRVDFTLFNADPLYQRLTEIIFIRCQCYCHL